MTRRRSDPGLGSAPGTRIDVARLLRRALTITGFVVAAAVATGLVQFTIVAGYDTRLFYDARLPLPYHVTVYGDPDGFFYSPAVAQGLALVNWLPWEVFRGAWGIVNAGIFVWLAGPFALPLLLLWPLAPVELLSGNANLAIAWAIVVGFRYPGLWSVPLLTKVTPGLGLLWFALRREWHGFFVGIGVTAAISVVSFVLAPDLWWEWARLLSTNAGVIAPLGVHIPFVDRLPVAVILLIWGARTNRPALLPMAALFAMPVLSGGSYVLVIAALRIWVLGPYTPKANVNVVR